MAKERSKLQRTVGVADVAVAHRRRVAAERGFPIDASAPAGVRALFQGGEKHELTGVSFVAQVEQHHPGGT